MIFNFVYLNKLNIINTYWRNNLRRVSPEEENCLLRKRTSGKTVSVWAKRFWIGYANIRQNVLFQNLKIWGILEPHLIYVCMERSRAWGVLQPSISVRKVSALAIHINWIKICRIMGKSMPQ